MGLFDVIKKVYKDGDAIDPPTTDYQDQKISFWASNYVYKLESGEVVVIFDDITKNIVNEQELNKFKRLFDTSLFGYAIADSSGNLSYLNNYFAQSHGDQSEELTGQPISILHSEDQFVEVAKIIDEFLETGNFGPTNIHHFHKNGTIQYVNPAFEKLTGYTRQEAVGNNPRVLKSGTHSVGFYENMWATIASGRVWKGRICNKRKDGTLAGGIAHDFNNILTAINGFTILALESLPEDHDACEDLQQVLLSGDRAADLVKQILLYSRKEDTDFYPLQPATILKETYKMLKASMPPGIKLTIACADDCHIINAAPSQIQQIFMNLATNATHAMEKRGGTLSLFLANSPANENMDVPHIVFTISDSGTGIDEKNKDKIFDPFFTTKAIGEGTGLGLAVVQGIVESHNGSIIFRSRSLHGSLFTIRIPSIPSQDIPQQTKIKSNTSSNGEHILIVDDEPAVGQILQRILNKAGYQTTCFKSSRKAPLHFNNNPAGYDFLKTDFIMPDIDGNEHAMLMVQKDKDLEVIICTGHIGSLGKVDDTKRYPTNFLYKPIKKEVLLKTVQKVLNNKN